MRHARSGKKLGRDAAHRKALYANLTNALIEHGRIKTTVTKAKVVKPIAEQMITLGRRGDIHARRQAIAFLRSKDIVHRLFTEVGPYFAQRPGGYTRIVRIGPRYGDAAEMVYLELVDSPLVFKTKFSDLPESVQASVTAAGATATDAEDAPVADTDASGETATSGPGASVALAETGDIEDIEGIGPAFGKKLRAAGVSTIKELLEAAKTADGRTALAEQTKLKEESILTWASHADLLRVPGIDPQFAELLAASGVDSPAELAGRDAANLTAKLAEVEAEKNLVPELPDEATVAAWVEAASALDKHLEH